MTVMGHGSGGVMTWFKDDRGSAAKVGPQGLSLRGFGGECQPPSAQHHTSLAPRVRVRVRVGVLRLWVVNIKTDMKPLITVSYTHLRAHETPEHLVCRLLLEKKNTRTHTFSIVLADLHIKIYRYVMLHL
eukprot:TRINITY_DN52344_c0_g1_i1.p1 TRINITY_DN52344_c0_g1~~TRINITY_DN52344_c0_g1_i1.p1  ORF type:complete len:130 (-),score=4.07 TRINITY_DN52344_c0_g1_i1:10-399(-)